MISEPLCSPCEVHSNEVISKSPGQLAAVVFSALYALCAFTLGYFYSIPSFDSFALLPLVMLGLLALMREGKYKLFIVSLTLAVFSNFLIGFYICVFTAIMFGSHCIIQKLNIQNFLRKLGLIAFSSAAAIGMTAVLTYPTFFAMQNTVTASEKGPDSIIFYNNFASVLGNFITYTPPVIMDSLPFPIGQINLYSGIICVLFIALFLRSSKISRREKIVHLCILAFIVLSCNLNVFDYFWNGFNFTFGIYFRFSFLVSFMLVTMAYRVFIFTETLNRRDILFMGMITAFFLLMGVIGYQKTPSVIFALVLGVLYLLILYFLHRKKTGRQQTVLNAVFLAVIVAELFVSSLIGVKTTKLENRNDYHDRYGEVQKLLNMRQPVDLSALADS